MPSEISLKAGKNFPENQENIAVLLIFKYDFDENGIMDNNVSSLKSLSIKCPTYYLTTAYSQSKSFNFHFFD